MLPLVSPATVTVGIAVVRAVGWVHTEGRVSTHAAAAEVCSTLALIRVQLDSRAPHQLLSLHERC